jgi:hypothetical protein
METKKEQRDSKCAGFEVEEAMAQSCERDLYPRAGQNREGQN